MLLQSFSVIIYRGISAPGNGREVVDSLNAFDKMILFQWMLTMKLTGEKGYDTQMVMHTGTHIDISPYPIYDIRGVEKYGSNGAGLWDYVQVCGIDSDGV